MAMQALVIAHAAYGHNSFFKGNYLFRMWTDASSIIDYLVYAKNYVAECEERHGLDAVEEFLDSCHALSNHGVDRYRRPSRKIAGAGVARAQGARGLCAAPGQRPVAHAAQAGRQGRATRPRAAASPKSRRRTCCTSSRRTRRCWSRGSARSCASCARWRSTSTRSARRQVMNEGWATFWHYHILNQMYDDGYLSDGVMMEWLKSHTNVIYQPPVGHPAYSGINPYALGFAMYTDLKRICETPTDEDRHWFPDIAGSRLGADARPRDAQLQGRELHRPVPEPEDDARVPPVHHRRRREGKRARSRRHPRRLGLPPRARGAVAAVRPRARASPTSRCGTSTCAATAR